MEKVILTMHLTAKDVHLSSLPKGVMRGQEMLYMTTMERISSIRAYCSPNLHKGRLGAFNMISII